MQQVCTLQPNRKHYELIDYLKGFSILTIVCYHLLQFYIHVPGLFSKAVSLGGSGVHVFFVVSGFGLYNSHLRSPKTFLDFLRKRFSKIYVPYILVVFLCFCIPFMYQQDDRLMALLSHVLLFKMFIPRYEGSFGEPFWFISTIIQFYLCFHLAVWLRKRLGSRRRFVAGSLLVSLCWWIICAVFHFDGVRVLSSCFLQYFWEFALGMMLAEYLFEGKEIRFKPAAVLCVSLVGLTIFGVMAMRGGALKLFNDIPALLGYGGCALSIYFFCGKKFRKLIVWISGFSYEWYLTHLLVFECIYYFAPDFRPVRILLGIAAFAGSMAVAWSYRALLRSARTKAL